MPLLTSGAGGILSPAEINEIITVPVQRASVAYRVSTPVVIRSHQYRFPKLSEEPSAAWVLEGQEGVLDDAVVGELVVTPAKVLGMSTISRELAKDSINESAAGVIGTALSFNIAKQIDVAMFGDHPPANAAPGLFALGNDVSVVDASAGVTNTDAFLHGMSLCEEQGALVSFWVASPATALHLATLKRQEGSEEQLLQPDPTLPSQRVISGVPLLVTPACPNDVVWGIPGLPDHPGALSFVVQHEDVTFDVDQSVYRTSQRWLLSASVRVAFGWPHAKAVVRVELPGFWAS